MFHLLRIEWLKLRSYKAFWILLILTIGFSSGWNYFLATTIRESKKNAIAKNPMAHILPNPYELPGTWQMVCYVNSYFVLTLGILMILLLTNEYNFRTSRQNIIDGLTRADFAISKLLLMLGLSIVATAITFGTTVFVAKEISGSSEGMWDNVYLLGYFFVQCLMYLLVALLIAMLVKRSGLAIGLYFFLMIADSILGGVLNRYVHPLGYFLPIDGTDNLIPNPVRKFVPDADRPDDKIIISFSVGYIVLFVFLFLNYFRKADLK
jgi:ABC-2 type transport system permease protein